MITSDEIAKLSALARIQISEVEKKSLANDLTAILDYISEINEASAGTGSVDMAPERNVFRSDSIAEQSGAHTDILLASAPRTENSFVVVKKILGVE
ncbi:MAG: aspartyl/glutamyl-tRNA amidotransferase subunit C [Candidatus Vogelbacteria bacterium]|nr:aspartyl/glutamyl-tRNA amidotransferase subunit C [Candidatus Vogelbacteria bacterium]